MFSGNKKVKRFVNYFVGPVLAIWLFYSLYQQIRTQQHLQQSIDLIKQAPFGAQAVKFWIIIMLVFVNWGLEARKWQVIVRLLQPLSFARALKGIFSGVAVSLNTPNRIGEYGGRILFIEEGNRLKAISLSIISGISQLIVTVLMGAIGLFWLLQVNKGAESIMGLSLFWIELLMYSSISTTAILLLMYLKLSYVTRIIESVPIFKKYTPYIAVIETFSYKILLRLFSLSFLRYLIFVLQYILLLQVLDVQMTIMQSFWTVAILFLVLAIVPSFAIADLGIRGKFSVALFSLYSSNVIGIIGITFGIWLLNLFLPALAGCVFILGARIYNEDKTMVKADINNQL
jgi:hypothetical protein